MTKLTETLGTLIICDVKFNLHNEESWNDTENVLATTLCTQFGWNKDQFARDIDYVKFLSWKVAHGILESIIKANREGKITIFASQKYSKWYNIELTHYY